MKKKITPFQWFALWLGIVTLPYIARKITEEKFTGQISALNISSDKSIGYYIFPGTLYPSDEVFKGFFQPKKYDFNVVHYGYKDYDPDFIAEQVAEHAKTVGYKKVRVISISIGDQLLSGLNICLKDKVRDASLEIVSIDSLPNPDFISEKYRKPLKTFEPLIVTLRTLGGWLLELPLIRRTGRWHSPAVLMEQIVNLTSWNYDYPADEILDCVVAVIKDDEVFYAPDNSEELFETTYNWPDEELGDDPQCRIYYNYNGKLADFLDEPTQKGYKRVFGDLKWQF